MLFLFPADERRDPTDSCAFKGPLDVKYYSSFVSNVCNKFGFPVTVESQQGNILLRGYDVCHNTSSDGVSHPILSGAPKVGFFYFQPPKSH